MTNRLINQILQSRVHYKRVVGIANGGLTISYCLSYFLNIPHHTVFIRLRDGNGLDRLRLKQGMPLERPFLLVDDIIDSGETLRVFKSFGYTQGLDFDVATLHWCAENKCGEQPDFYVSLKEKDDWIVYPWEKEYEERPITEKN